MKAVVFHGIGDIRLEDVSEPQIKRPTDAVVRITASAVCGTDLHFIRGTFPGMEPGTILGHEAVGIVEQIGSDVRNLRPGDRVIVPSTIACGYCSYCRAGYFSQCDNANPHGPRAGTCFFGGPAATGPVNGLQAEKAVIPFANVGLVKVPDEVTDDQALMLSDIFPTGYFAADIAEIEDGDTVVVFGCGPVGQFAIASARLMGAGRIFAVDCIPDRLEIARAAGAEVIDFEADDPVETLLRLTGGIGVDRAIDAVGVDACHAHGGPASRAARENEERFITESKTIAPQTNPQGGNWHPGDAPNQALEWAVQSLAKAGTLAIVGVYPPGDRFFPIGAAMNRNLTVNMGNCPHRKYVPMLLDLVQSGVIDPSDYVTQDVPLTDAVTAIREFDRRSPGWLKVMLEPGMARPTQETPTEGEAVLAS